MTAALKVGWQDREPPLPPVAVCATGDAAVQLGRRLLREDPTVLSDLVGVGGPGLLCVAGSPDRLPWVDGVVYLGRDPAAPGVLLPTTMVPDVPVGLLARALLRKVEEHPIVVLPRDRRVFTMASARPLDRDLLEAWLEVRA